MALKLEDINNLIADDLDKRNENWTEIDNTFVLKADKSTTYTKAEVDTSLELKANKQQEAWITPTLLNGASSMEGFPVQYMKDSLGFVHWRGRLTGGASNSLISIPVGYRPLTETTITLGANTPSVWNRVMIYPVGSFYQYYTERPYTILDSIIYKAEL